MSVKVDYIQIARNALGHFRAWEESLDKLRPLVIGGCADTALRVALGKLNGTITWLNNFILWEKEAQCEKKTKEEGGEK